MTDKKIPIHRLERADKFVRVHKLGPGKFGFRLSEFLEWMRNQPSLPKDEDG